MFNASSGHLQKVRRNVQNLCDAGSYAAQAAPAILSCALFIGLAAVFVPPAVFWVLATQKATETEIVVATSALLAAGLIANVVSVRLRLLGAEHTGRLLVSTLSSTLARAARLEDFEKDSVASSLCAAHSGAAHLPGVFNMALNCLNALCRLAAVVILVVVVHPAAAVFLVLMYYLHSKMSRSVDDLAPARRAYGNALASLAGRLDTFHQPAPRTAIGGLHLQESVNKRTSQLAENVLEHRKRVAKAERRTAQQKLRSRVIVAVFAAGGIFLGSVLFSREDVVSLVVIAPMLLGAAFSPGHVFDFFDRVSGPFRSVLYCDDALRPSDPTGYSPREVMTQRISYDYGQKRVLKSFGLTDTLHPLMTLTGPNGSGKTTLCEVITGLRMNQEPSGVSAASSERSSLAFGLQKQDLTGLTVREVFEFTGALSGDRDVWNVLDSWDIAYLLRDRNMALDDVIGAKHGFSGGECQILLNCAILARSDAQTIVLDEPFSALDSGRCKQLGRRLRDCAADAPDRVILVVAHGKHADLLDAPTVALAQSER